MFGKQLLKVVFAVAGLAPGAAQAFTIETEFTHGCHEEITGAAFRAVRTQLKLAAAPAPTVDEQALIEDVPFSLPSDLRDLAGTTLLIGVRDNDLKGAAGDDLSVLASIHGNPQDQPEHCLRTPGEDEPGGSASAIMKCRAFIQMRVMDAVAALGANGEADFSKRTTLTLHLALRGKVDAPLPTFYIRIGQAVHALEDSFTHTYRTADGMKITVALNWLDYVSGKLVESKNGPAHNAKLDVCDDPDDLRKRNRELATAAATELLLATLDPSKSGAEKIAAANAVLDKYMTFSPGCTFENGWCQAAEAQLSNGAAGCSVSSGDMGVVAMLAAVLALVWARRRRGAQALMALCVASAVMLLGPSGARAGDAEPGPDGVGKVAEPGPSDPSEMAWGAYFGGSGSIDKSALAIEAGARLRLGKHWTVGLDGEWNPWVSLSPANLRKGVVNAYGTFILRFPLASENFNLRFTGNLGVSYLIDGLYGAPAGKTGLYIGLSPAGIEWKLSRTFYLIINPLNIAIPVPQITGVPLTYPQYRFSIGLELLDG